MLSKNSVCSTHSATLESDGISVPKIENAIMHIGIKLWGQGQIQM